MQGFALLGTVTLMLGLSLATPPEKRFVLAKADLDRFTRELKDRWIKTGSRLVLHGTVGIEGRLSFRLEPHPGLAPSTRVWVRRAGELLAEVRLVGETLETSVDLRAAPLRSPWLEPLPIELSCDHYVRATDGVSRCARLGRLTFHPFGAPTIPVLLYRTGMHVLLAAALAVLVVRPLTLKLPAPRSWPPAAFLTMTLALAFEAHRDAYVLAWAIPPLPAMVALSLLLAVVLRGAQPVGEAAATPHSTPATARWPQGQTIVALVVLLLCALVLRFWRIPEIPNGLSPDEARHGIEALRYGPNPLSWPVYDESLHSPSFGPWLLGLGVHAFGIHPWSMRPITALAGALTLVPFYLFVRRLLAKERVAALGAAFLTASSWHLFVSRDQSPAVFDPLFLLMGLWLLTETPAAVDSHSRMALAALAGASIGLGMQTYHTGRLGPLYACLVMLALGGRLRERRKTIAGFLVGLGLAICPLAIWLAGSTNTDRREAPLTVAAVAVRQAEAPLSALDRSFVRHLLMFNVPSGEGRSRPARPLDTVTGLAMAVGILRLALSHRDRGMVVVVFMLCLGLLPSALAMGEPHAQSAIGALAPACILAAWGWSGLCEVTRRFARPALTSSLMIAAPLLVLLATTQAVFVQAPSDDRPAPDSMAVQVGVFLRETARSEPETAVYVPERMLESSVLGYLARGTKVRSYATASLTDLPRAGDLFILGGDVSPDDGLPEISGLELRAERRAVVRSSQASPAFDVYRAQAVEARPRRRLAHGDTPQGLSRREDGLFASAPVDRPSSGAVSDDAAERLAALGYLTGYEKPTIQAGVRTYANPSGPLDYNLYTSGHAPVAVLMDMRGSVLYEWRYDLLQEPTLRPIQTRKMRRGTKYMRRAWLYPNGDLLGLFDWGGLVKVDKASRRIWFNNASFHHDIDVQRDGTIFTLGEAPIEDTALGPGRLDNTIVALDAQGRVRQSVSLWTAFRNTFSLARIKELLNLELTDLFHANSVDVLEADATAHHPAFTKGRALVSMRSPSLIALLDLDAPRIELLLKGTWARQHEARLLENGNILFFDNEGLASASRVLELTPPEWSIAWSYRADPPSSFFSRQQGTVRRLANGNTLVTESMRGRAFELNPQKEIIWEFVSPHRAAEDEALVAVLLDVRRIDGRFPLDWRGVKTP